eukprot:CAMPEP_0201575786 /NCGR_PEP_ID=MMETSP0190_2-20130828/21202_1 /ASSEMBLY_ACC=CAM_ASM_000263 /TAXON_ID=37353 /ORGANISM="Rosalina sp." /LENGTH=785 /DNA_ID=CAMNT_0048005855 /DNA_START=12 /DNA_END=2369 /DNA_ORIENTATION=-
MGCISSANRQTDSLTFHLAGIKKPKSSKNTLNLYDINSIITTKSSLKSTDTILKLKKFIRKIYKIPSQYDLLILYSHHIISKDNNLTLNDFNITNNSLLLIAITVPPNPRPLKLSLSAITIEQDSLENIIEERFNIADDDFIENPYAFTHRLQQLNINDIEQIGTEIDHHRFFHHRRDATLYDNDVSALIRGAVHNVDSSSDEDEELSSIGSTSTEQELSERDMPNTHLRPSRRRGLLLQPARINIPSTPLPQERARRTRTRHRTSSIRHMHRRNASTFDEPPITQLIQRRATIRQTRAPSMDDEMLGNSPRPLPSRFLTRHQTDATLNLLVPQNAVRFPSPPPEIRQTVETTSQLAPVPVTRRPSIPLSPSSLSGSPGSTPIPPSRSRIQTLPLNISVNEAAIMSPRYPTSLHSHVPSESITISRVQEETELKTNLSPTTSTTSSGITFDINNDHRSLIDNHEDEKDMNDIDLMPMKGFDIIMQEDDVLVYKMPHCGHVMNKESLYEYAMNQFKDSSNVHLTCPHPTDEERKSNDNEWGCTRCTYLNSMDRDECEMCTAPKPEIKPYCGCKWDYSIIKKVLAPQTKIASIDDEEHHIYRLAQLELLSARNKLQNDCNIQKCPGCDTLYVREDEAGEIKNKADLEYEFKTKCIYCSATNKSRSTLSFCFGCGDEWMDGHICDDTFRTELVEILAKAETKTIGEVKNVPAIRCCPECSQLITHTDACKHMKCKGCKTDFCFVCLKKKKNGNWQCGSHSTVCPVAKPQDIDALPDTIIINKKAFKLF